MTASNPSIHKAGKARAFDGERLSLAADHLRRVGLQAEERGHTNLASLCWMKRVEAMNEMGHRVALDARAQHARYPRIF